MANDECLPKTADTTRPLTYILRHADTRCLEFAGGVFCFLWAAYLLFNIKQADKVFHVAMWIGGGPQLWAWLAAFNFALQLLSLYWKWPRLRRVASFICCTYWSWVMWNMFMQDGLFMPWIAGFWATVQFWILARRVAIGK